MGLLQYIIFFVYLISLISLLALILILFNSRNKPWGFIGLILSLFLWLTPQFVAQYFTSTNKNYSEILVKLSFIFGSFVVASLYLFLKNLSFHQGIVRERLLLIFSVIAPFIAMISISPISNINIEVSQEGIIVTSNNIIYPLFLLLIFLSFILAIISIWSTEKQKQTIYTKEALKLLRTGFVVALVITLVGAIFFSDNALAQVLTPISMAFLSMIAYIAIFRHGLFSVRTVVARSFAYTASIAVIIVLYALLTFTAARYVFDINLTTTQEVYFATFSALTALLFQPIKKYFDKITNRIFYRDAYDSQDFLNKVNSALVGEVDLYKLLSNTATTVYKNLKINFCNFYIDEEAALDFHVVGTDAKVFGNENWPKLLKKMSEEGVKTVSETDNKEDVSKLLTDAKIGAVIKMTSQDQDVGYLIAGQKLSGNTYSNQDVQILEIIADEVAIAVQNTLRFEEIAQFNITLQKRIEDATAQLQKTNEKLVALDEAKDEFISMASHQLRTPLTSIKGYLSMLQEGDVGDLNEQQHNFVDQAFLSSQRMVYLIADLLNVSRLKTGKFVIEPKPTYLPDVVEGELAQLTETIKARGLEMEFEKPSEFPVMNLDETKVRQVIMNFADNAIYYTPNGGKITVKLEADDNNVTYTVTDTGIGVPKSEQHKLFTKFYRAGNAKKARPDGTGLGLFMAKKVVAAQGGAIIFKTQEGKGSTFGFSFPRARLELKDTPTPKAEEPVLV